ncbi:ETEC_3214 domain-containing protein [Marinomonas flavescens]|uniref:ETEC_3214 domain-containing protein n=1 Tax=Marinomonas flavescens TaxID=2529379 RepID=UPI00105534E2|nr:ETEC_3214 domain-containing protein [Marinomonas flavescens]
MYQPSTQKTSFYKRAQAITVLIASVMISFGSWNDTKELLTEVYDSGISNFTNNVEFSHLDNVKFGGNLDFMEQTFGIAKVIKHSTTAPNLEYRYYTDRKYILAVATQKKRIIAYQVVSLNSAFDPSLPFSTLKLGSFSYSKYADNFDEFRLDSANITYYMESHSLGRAGLFLNEYLAYVGYGAEYSESKKSISVNKQTIGDLDKALLESNKTNIKILLKKLRNDIRPNVFVIGDIDAPTAADMLLTRYEYAVYFKDQL